jgi:uncharacterized damage-inducible protein DinB
VRVARGLETGGFYNAAKLLWAAAFSDQIRATNDRPLLSGTKALEDELEATIKELEKTATQPELIAALRSGQQALTENRTIPHREIPDVHVCRTCGEIILGERPTGCPACGAHGLTLRTVQPIYFLEYLPPEQVLAALASAPDDLQVLTEGLRDQQLALPPDDGGWSVQQVLWHLLVAQRLLAHRVARMLAEDHPTLESLAAWAVEGKEEMGARAILASYQESREGVVKLLRDMPAEGWWRTGWHEEWGSVTVLAQATYFARHERSHWSQIAAARRRE